MARVLKSPKISSIVTLYRANRLYYTSEENTSSLCLNSSKGKPKTHSKMQIPKQLFIANSSLSTPGLSKIESVFV